MNGQRLRPRVVFMGTPEFAVPSLEQLQTFCDILLVITQPDRPSGRGMKLVASPVKVKATEFGFPVLQPEKKISDSDVEKIRSLDADFLVVVAFGQILKKNVLDIPKYCALNVHGSLLPRWRGAAPIQRALEAGDEKSGVVTMKMDIGLDTGPVYLSSELTNTAKTTSVFLYQELARKGAQLLQPTIEGIITGSLLPKPQDSSMATLAPKLRKEEGYLDLKALSATEMDRRIRAFQPWPGCKLALEIEGHPYSITILEASVIRSIVTRTVGTVTMSDLGLEVATKQDTLLVSKLKPEGRAAVPVREFLNGILGKSTNTTLRIVARKCESL